MKERLEYLRNIENTRTHFTTKTIEDWERRLAEDADIFTDQNQEIKTEEQEKEELRQAQEKKRNTLDEEEIDDEPDEADLEEDEIAWNLMHGTEWGHI